MKNVKSPEPSPPFRGLDQPSGPAVDRASDQALLTVTEWIERPELRRIISFVTGRCGLEGEDALDLRQDVMLALCRAGENRRINAAWILRTAFRRASLLKRSSRRLDEELDPEACAAPERVDPSLRHLLRARVDVLPSVMREFYGLRFEKGLSQKEIAGEL